MTVKLKTLLEEVKKPIEVIEIDGLSDESSFESNEEQSTDIGTGHKTSEVSIK
jgi:hypothetical protein